MVEPAHARQCSSELGHCSYLIAAFCASSHPITYLGAKPVFVGSEPETWNMDPVLLENLPKACGDCKTHTPEIEAVCDKTVVIIDSNGKDVECIQLEWFIDNYTHLKAIQSGKKCDLMLVGEDKVVLCDMTCSKAKYIDPFDRKDGSQQTGKRNTVRKQIANAILLLRDVPEIASEIDNRVRKIALFAYRVKDSAEGMDDFDGKVRSGMRFFSEPAERLISEPMYADMEGGFVFTEIRYPNKYMW